MVVRVSKLRQLPQASGAGGSKFAPPTGWPTNLGGYLVLLVSLFFCESPECLLHPHALL